MECSRDPKRKDFGQTKRKKKIKTVIHLRLEMEVICINYKDHHHKDEDPGGQPSDPHGGRQKVLRSGYLVAFSINYTKRQSFEKG